MRSHLKALFLIAGFLSPVSGYTQVAELGLSGGIAPHAGAYGNIYYKAGKMGFSPVASLTLVNNINHLSNARLTCQAGFNISTVFKLQNKTDNTYVYFNEHIGNDGKSFRYANSLLSIAPVVNLKYKLSEISYVYGGILVGIATSRNVSNHKGSDFIGTGFTYTAPNGGFGYCAGIHGGWTRRLTQRIAFNADIAARYYHLNFRVNDKDYPGGTKFSYGTFIIPVTVGIRYRIGWPKKLDYATGHFKITKEEIDKKEKKNNSSKGSTNNQ